MTKKCNTCGLEKPIDAFRMDRIYIKNKCRDCERAYMKARYDANPEKCAAIARAWSKEHPERRNATKRAWYAKNKAKHKATVILRSYGVTAQQYGELLRQQNGKCAICGCEPKTRARRLCVDHNHETGKVRGLLCSPCNSVLGFVKDSTTVLTAAIQYLNR